MTKRSGSRTALVVTVVYCLLCTGALALPLIAKPGENLAAAYAILLAMPWSILFGRLLDSLGTNSVAFNYFVLTLGMAINAVLLYLGISAISARFR